METERRRTTLKPDYLPFTLSDHFFASYIAENGDPFSEMDDNGLAAATLARTYLRSDNPRLPEGQLESWGDLCRRVIEGMFSFKYEHFININADKGYDKKPGYMDFRDQWLTTQAAVAELLFDGLYHLKWSPPGRGLHMMGTEFVNGRKKVEALQNCAFRSTAGADRVPGEVFGNVMDLLMMGVGVGYDTEGRGTGLYEPRKDLIQIVRIEDSREGWAESVERLVGSYLSPGAPTYQFDYDAIRPAGQPIRGFGGVASGPEPLRTLHNQIRNTFGGRGGGHLTSQQIVDTFNQIGACVVAGNVRRSAEIALGNPGDESFGYLKDYERNPARGEWGWVSNNSYVYDEPPTEYHHLEQTVKTGEPGFVFRYNFPYGRIRDAELDATRRADKAKGINPCGEIPLEDGEMCTLAEVYLPRMDINEWPEWVAAAYHYAKVVTLANQHISNARSREVMMKNRRVGVGVTGVTQAIQKYKHDAVLNMLSNTYQMLVKTDETFSRNLDVPPSVRLTTVKPSGTMSTVANVTSGVHYAIKGRYYLRAVRFAKDHALVPLLQQCGYPVEDAIDSRNTKVVYFPVDMGPLAQDADEVTPLQHMELVAQMQESWSDNGVSATITLPEGTTSTELGGYVNAYKGRLKAISFLPSDHEYRQAPYQRLTEARYKEMSERITPFRLSMVVHTDLHPHDSDDLYCSGEACELPGVDSIVG